MKTEKRSSTSCLLCNKVVNPKNHRCVKEKWTKYYGCFEEIINVKDLGSLFNSKITSISRKFIRKEKVSIWDFAEFIPVKKQISLGEGGTPLYKLEKYRSNSGCKIYIKNEGINPSQVFKDRESSVAISQCINNGYKKISLASTGNAAQSISLYAKEANIQPFLFISDKASRNKIATMIHNNAKLIILKDSYMEDAFKMSRDISEFLDGLEIKDCNPGIDWIRREGDKTIAYELYTQLKHVPDWIILACGNGSSTHGIFKGFKEMKKMGIIDKLPRMVGVQIKGGDPIPQGVNLQMTKKPIEISNPPPSLGDSAVASFDYIAAVQAILESKGLGIGVKDSEVASCLSSFIRDESHLLRECIPEVTTAEILAAFDIMLKRSVVKKGESVVLFFSSHGFNSRDQLKELLGKYGYYNEWKKIEKYLPDKLENFKYDSVSFRNSVKIVPKNIKAVKNAVKELVNNK